MGLNDNVYNISKTMLSEKQERKQLKEKKELLKDEKEELKSILLNELIDLYNNNVNIYIDDVKDNTITNILNQYIKGLYNQTWRNKFEKDYKKDVEKYLLQNYYSIASQAERISKKQNERKGDYKKQLAFAKFEWQKEKEQQKIDLQKIKEAERIRQQQAKINIKQAQQTQQILNSCTGASCSIIYTLIKITGFLILAPIIVAGALFIGFISALSKIK